MNDVSSEQQIGAKARLLAEEATRLVWSAHIASKTNAARTELERCAGIYHHNTIEELKKMPRRSKEEEEAEV